MASKPRVELLIWIRVPRFIDAINNEYQSRISASLARAVRLRDSFSQPFVSWRNGGAFYLTAEPNRVTDSHLVIQLIQIGTSVVPEPNDGIIKVGDLQ